MTMQFLWSDAWLLQAVALASRDEPASLAAVLAAADSLNHALPIHDELHGALVRLVGEGFVSEQAELFVLGPRVSHADRIALGAANARRGREVAATLLSSEPWTSETNVRDPRNDIAFPGLTVARLRAAEDEYRRKGPR